MEQLKDPGVRQSILKLKSSLIQQNSTPYRNNQALPSARIVTSGLE